MAIRVASWNLFHGRSQPGRRGDLLPAFAGALDSVAWDVCALQEVPPWWPEQLAQRLRASVRTTRTTLIRSALPSLQRAVHTRDPERIGVRGAAVNALLIRPEAGALLAHQQARLRRCPQRRTMHGVALRRPGGELLWIVNVHTHNRPESAAARDTLATLAIARTWAAAEPRNPDAPVIVAGDLNLHSPQGLVRLEGFDQLHGAHVDHIAGRGVGLAGGEQRQATRLHAPGDPKLLLSDHRLIAATLAA